VLQMRWLRLVVGVATIAVPLFCHFDTAVSRAGEIEIIEGVPPGFEMVRLTNDPTMQHSVPDINDAGEVVFGKFVTADALGNLYRFADGRITQITESATYDLNPVTNNDSQMAWITCANSSGPFRVVGDYLEDSVEGGIGPAGFIDMNDRGDIVWKHRVPDTDSDYDIYLYLHAEDRVIQITDGGNNQSARLNNLGDVVWRERDDSVSPWVGRIKVYSDGIITDITPGVCACHSPGINDDEMVVYRNGTEDTLMLWDGRTHNLIAETAFTPRLNNASQIGFAMLNESEGVVVHAILSGNVIYQLPNFGFTTSRSSINDRGEMAMRMFDVLNGHTEVFLLRRIGPKGDLNYDCIIDRHDAWILQRCETAPPGPEGQLLAECIRADFDDDGDVDSHDLECFQDEFTGAKSLVPDCEL
jgi:hypothetical protein